MTKQGLGFIASVLKKADIPYCFAEWTKEVTYPYFVGEYTETEPLYEYGETESTFIITGTTNNSRASLENIKEKIIGLFGYEGLTHTFEDKRAIAVMYAKSQNIPTNTDSLKRIEITLKIKEWRVD